MHEVLESGRTIDRYVVEDVLGQGGMATVYRVRHAHLGSRHALKILDLSSRSMRERFLQEGRLQATLTHRHIVSVSDVVDVDGSVGLVMELVDGPTLGALLRQRLLTWDEIDTLAVGVLKGVGVAHARGLVHRDLKPANVLIATEDGAWLAKVADFGLAKLLDDPRPGGSGPGTRTGMTMGTPAYMAPEQTRDAKTVDARADVWALGTILYELCTRQVAFDGDDLVETFSAIRSGTYVPVRRVRPSVPARMERAIEAALVVDRDRRCPDVAALLAIWNGGLWEPVRSDPTIGPLDSGAHDAPDPSPSQAPTAAPPTVARSDAPTLAPRLPSPPRRPWTRWVPLVILLVGAVALAALAANDWQPYRLRIEVPGASQWLAPGP